MKPSIGRIVHYVNLGDKDGKFPPEIQAATITGVYHTGPGGLQSHPNTGNNNPLALGLAPANKLGDVADAPFADLKVQYRTGMFDMVCVPFSEEPTRGHWTWPPRVQS